MHLTLVVQYFGKGGDMETIWYKGVAYPARTITIDNKDLLVSVVALWDEINEDISNGDDEYAQPVDDNIFYYCRDEQELNSLTDEEIYNLTC